MTMNSAYSGETGHMLSPANSSGQRRAAQACHAAKKGESACFEVRGRAQGGRPRQHRHEDQVAQRANELPVVPEDRHHRCIDQLRRQQANLRGVMPRCRNQRARIAQMPRQHQLGRHVRIEIRAVPRDQIIRRHDAAQRKHRSADSPLQRIPSSAHAPFPLCRLSCFILSVRAAFVKPQPGKLHKLDMPHFFLRSCLHADFAVL